MAFARKFHQIKFQQSQLQGGTLPQQAQQQQQLQQQLQQQQQQLQQQSQQQNGTLTQSMAQTPQQQVQQTSTPVQSMAQIQQQQQSQQAQMLALQRTAAQAMAAAAAAGNNVNANNGINTTQGLNNINLQQLPLNILQNLNLANGNQVSPRQIQMYLARQAALQQQQQQQQGQQQTADTSNINNLNQNFRPSVSSVNATSSPLQLNNFSNVRYIYSFLWLVAYFCATI